MPLRSFDLLTLRSRRAQSPTSVVLEGCQSNRALPIELKRLSTTLLDRFVIGVIFQGIIFVGGRVKRVSGW